MLKLLFICLIIFIVYYLYLFYNSKENKRIEHFTEKIPDKIYSNLNYHVFSYQKIYNIEIKKILPLLKNISKNKILLIYVGNTRHIKELLKLNINLEVIDNDSSSINLLKNKLPFFEKIKFNSPILTENYKNNSFDSILCMHQYIYENNKTEFIRIIANIQYWLKNNGLLFITIFDRDKLDPGPREYSMYYDKGKNKHALTYFKNLTHDANFEIENDEYVIYNQKYIINDKKIKNKVTRLYMPSIKTIFKILNRNNLEHVNTFSFDTDDYKIYIFKKYQSNNKYINI